MWHAIPAASHATHSVAHAVPTPTAEVRDTTRQVGPMASSAWTGQEKGPCPENRQLTPFERGEVGGWGSDTPTPRHTAHRRDV